jgi:anti-sigma B factor antagonist
MALEIDVFKKENENVIILQLRGSLDTQTYQQLTDLARQKISKTLKGIILDLEPLEYISSMGISAILQVRQMLESQGAQLMMSNIPNHIDQVFRTVKALPDVKIFESMEEADRYFLEIQRRAKGG